MGETVDNSNAKDNGDWQKSKRYIEENIKLLLSKSDTLQESLNDIKVQLAAQNKPCAVHEERLHRAEVRLNGHHDELKIVSSFRSKAIGALIIIYALFGVAAAALIKFVIWGR